MNQMDNELRCKSCGKQIKGGCYNAPDGPFCVDCWENKISVSIPSTPYFIKSSLSRTLQSKTTIKFEECLA